MRLSICVITMNRAEQLKEALGSCLACELPKETEFVVIDNASTDHTEQAVRETLGECGYPYYYEKLSENLGVGGGRNYAYEKACGEYAYMLDDDAVIDSEKDDRFFIKAVEILDSQTDIVTLTTQIYDTAWKKDRVETRGPAVSDGLYKCLMFCGGSHFLRRSFYKEPPYLPNKYGYEEIPPSLRAMNAGKLNAFCPSLLIIHKPAVNKWDFNDEKNHALLVKGISLPYAIKSMMYPKVALPFLKLAAKRRIKMYLQNVKDGDAKVKEAARRFCEEYPIKEKISLFTVFRMFKDFKLSIF
ncbi:MAG: glycosyltransferase [Clostridia bacterium]|nr:glycosyltransferase [Clostridia bacterium]